MATPGAGACWAFINDRLALYTYGFYPAPLRWRVNLAFVLLILAIIPVLYEKMPGRKYGLWYSAIFPFITGWLLVGGEILSLIHISEPTRPVRIWFAVI